MSMSKGQQQIPDQEDYLCVDRFMATLLSARALSSAFELGLVDLLQERGASGIDLLRQTLRLEPRALRLLLDLLRVNHVIDENQGNIMLAPQFRSALRFRDLMEAKLAFSRFVLPDLNERLTEILADPDRFFQDSRTIDLFSYGRCLDLNPENYSRTEEWVRITSCLTRYEAQVCMRHYDFGRHRRILDIGGNSGEMAFQFCRRYPHVRATVFDLPVVCEIGKAHLFREPEAEWISFMSGDALTDELPGGHDLIIFKSMLHDWPEGAAKHLLSKAARSLQPGGTVLIFERAPIVIRDSEPPFSMIPFLLFFRSFRSPATYADELKRLAFENIRIQTIMLEMEFFLLTASKRV